MLREPPGSPVLANTHRKSPLKPHPSLQSEATGGSRENAVSMDPDNKEHALWGLIELGPFWAPLSPGWEGRRQDDACGRRTRGDFPFHVFTSMSPQTFTTRRHVGIS